MDYNDCLDQNIIKENHLTINWINKEIKSANKFLSEAKTIFPTDCYNSCEIVAYSSMFHSVRALLYSKGFSEKGHYCLFVFISNLFKENEELINLLIKADKFRIARQDIAYDSLDTTIEEAINTVNDLLELTKKILNK